MLPDLYLALASFGLLCVIGLPVLLIAPEPHRAGLVVATPVLGAAALVVILHTAALVAPVKLLAPILLVAAVIAAGLSWRSWWTLGPAARTALPSLAAAGFVLGLSLLPAHLVQDATVLHVTSNHDAFFYVSTSQWLADSGMADPDLSPANAAGSDPAFFGPALSTMDQSLRLGENLVAAFLSILPGDSEHLWLPLSGLWPAMIALGAAALGNASGLGRRSVALVGALAGTQALVTYQVFNQNTPSLLGMSFALLFAAMFPLALAKGGRMIPLASIALAALVGTYTELAAVLAPALVLLVLLRPKPWLIGVRRSFVVLALGILCAPLIWVRAFRSLQVVADAGGLPGPLSDIGGVSFAAKVFGVIPYLSAPPASYTSLEAASIVLIAAFVVAGVTVSVRLPTGALWVAFSATVALLTYSLNAAEPPKGYTLGRMLSFCFPLILAGAALGLGALASWADKRGLERGSWTGAWAAIVAVVMMIGITTTLDYLRSVRSDIRGVDSSYSQADGWLDEIGDPTGDQVSVAAFDFVNQLWVSEATRERDGVAYPVLDPSYFRMSQSWDGSNDRYLLIDTSGLWSAPREAILRQNERFALLDTSVGVAALVPQGITSGSGWFANTPPGIPRTDGDSMPDTWMLDSASAFVQRSANGALSLLVTPNTAAGVVELAIEGPGVESTRTMVAGPTRVVVRFKAGVQSARISLTAVPASPVPPGEALLLFTGVEGA